MSKRKTNKGIQHFKPYSSSLGKLFKSRSLSSITEEVSLPDISLENFNMSNPQNDQAGPSRGSTQNTFSFESLRIPDAIKDLPVNEGNPRLLNEFINNVEEILMHIRSYDATPQGQILLRAIRNKIVGQANEVLNMYGTSLNWDDIKQNLILHYSDKRTETSLIRDLHNLRQNFNKVEKFYSEIIEIQASLINNVNIHEQDERVIKAKRDLYAEMCLNSFLIGLREPLGSIVRASQPQTLAEAFSLCIKEQNIFYMRSDPNKSQNRGQYTPYNKNKNNNRYIPFVTQQNTNYNTQYTHPQQSKTLTHYYSQPTQHKNTNLSNQNFNRNPFKGNSFNSHYKPEPMDISSGYMKPQAPSTQRSFKTDQTMRTVASGNQNKRGELFNIQEDTYLEALPQNSGYQQDLDSYQKLEEDGLDTEENSNFYNFASNNPQDT